MLNVKFVPNITTASSNALRLIKELATNDNLTFSESSVKVNEPGVYEIIGNITVISSAAGSTGAYINANDAMIGIESVFDATGADDTYTLPLYATLKADYINEEEFVEIEFIPVSAIKVLDGNVSIKKIV